jgi:hypothetical protein
MVVGYRKRRIRKRRIRKNRKRKKMSNHIDKDDPKRWFYVQDNGTGETSLVLFGNLGEVDKGELITGQAIVMNYLTEQELQTNVNTVAGNDEYYKDSVETESNKFMIPSGIYEYGAQIIEPEE